MARRMLIISNQNGPFVEGGRWQPDISASGSWHTGEIMRIPDGHVISFQADGDELQALVEMFRAAGVRVVWPSAGLTPIY